MGKIEQYRNNRIEVQEKGDGQEELRINDTVIDVIYDPSPHGEAEQSEPELTEHGTPEHGTPEHGTPGHGTPGHGTPGHGTPGHGGYRSRYAFMHAASLPELGQLIIDAQQSLTEPELPGLVPETEAP